MSFRIVCDRAAAAELVVGSRAHDFEMWVAGELQRSVRMLSGAELPILAAANRPRGCRAGC